jgi:hypothetical protein
MNVIYTGGHFCCSPDFYQKVGETDVFHDAIRRCGGGYKLDGISGEPKFRFKIM